MSKYLISTCETYRVDSELAAKQAIEEAKNNNSFTLLKYTSEYKEKKLKGEVVDSYYKVTLTKVFNDIKEPDVYVKIDYSVEPGFFPDPINNDDDEDNDEGVVF